MKLTKLQIEVLKKLQNGCLWKDRYYNKNRYKFSYCDLYVREKTVNSLAMKDLVEWEHSEINPYSLGVKLSKEGETYLALAKRKEDARIYRAIIARIPKELREPKIEYLKVGK